MALLWRRLVGTTVLDDGPIGKSVHVYAHCTRGRVAGPSRLSRSKCAATPPRSTSRGCRRLPAIRRRTWIRIPCAERPNPASRARRSLADAKRHECQLSPRYAQTAEHLLLRSAIREERELPRLGLGTVDCSSEPCAFFGRRSSCHLPVAWYPSRRRPSAFRRLLAHDRQAQCALAAAWRRRLSCMCLRAAA